MAVRRSDEVLGKALETDATPIPRYDLVAPDGSVVLTNVSLKLKNPIVTAGTPIAKTTLDECLAASGVTAGSATSLTLGQSNFTYFDGAVVRIRLHVDSGATPTLNVNNRGAKALMTTATQPLKAGIKAGTWLTFVYSSTLDFFVLQGSGGDTKAKYGNGPGQISHFELMMHGMYPKYTQ